jgi:hypothetical protein
MLANLADSYLRRPAPPRPEARMWSSAYGSCSDFRRWFHDTRGEGDYILIPEGTSYQIVPNQSNFSLIVETRGQIEFPDRGNIGHDAPFDYGDVENPVPEPIEDDGREWELRIKRRGQTKFGVL